MRLKIRCDGWKRKYFGCAWEAEPKNQITVLITICILFIILAAYRPYSDVRYIYPSPIGPYIVDALIYLSCCANF
jgi:hypothetical protein